MEIKECAYILVAQDTTQCMKNILAVLHSSFMNSCFYLGFSEKGYGRILHSEYNISDITCNVC